MRSRVTSTRARGPPARVLRRDERSVLKTVDCSSCAVASHKAGRVHIFFALSVSFSWITRGGLTKSSGSLSMPPIGARLRGTVQPPQSFMKVVVTLPSKPSSFALAFNSPSWCGQNRTITSAEPFGARVPLVGESVKLAG
eukprot:scaffold69933_cov25-Tisochrysis_lutea.AAC.2